MNSQEIWENFHVALTRFTRARISNEADAEDVLQEIFLKIHTGREALEDQERLAGWIFRVASNAVYDHHRRLGTGAREVFASQPSPKAESSQAEIRVEEEFALCVRPFIEMLDPPYRDALLLVEFEGRTLAEAADEVGISLSAMKSRVQRARKLLRGELESCCFVETDRRGTIIDYQVK